MNHNTNWTDEAVADLRALWDIKPQMSAAAIAEQISSTHGMELTRSAVIGKARRLHLDPHQKNDKTARPVKRTPHPQAARAFPMVKLSPLTVAPRVRVKKIPVGAFTIVTLHENGCRWPTSPEGDLPILFCGAPRSEEHQSYCRQHHELAWRRNGRI